MKNYPFFDKPSIVLLQSALREQMDAYYQSVYNDDQLEERKKIASRIVEIERNILLLNDPSFEQQNFRNHALN